MTLKDVFDYYYKKEDILDFLKLIEDTCKDLTIAELLKEIEENY